MKPIYSEILSNSKKQNLLAVLIDPDDFKVDDTEIVAQRINESIASYIFIGGSTVDKGVTQEVINQIKKYTKLPIVIFPGDPSQISDTADAILFLSLISGRNPEYLIGKQVEAVSKLRQTNLEVISTGYILIENGRKTSVEEVSKTTPISQNDIQTIIDTAKAGELLGHQCIYLEAGSGALEPVSAQIVRAVREEVKIPLIVGGGIRSKKQMDIAYEAGADLVVIGTAFEKDKSFFESLKPEYKKQFSL